MSPNEAHQARIRAALDAIVELHDATFHPDLPAEGAVVVAPNPAQSRRCRSVACPPAATPRTS